MAHGEGRAPGSMLASIPHQALLHRGSDEHARLSIKGPSYQPSSATCRGAMYVVEQPLRGREVPVKPHRVGEARDLHALGHPAHAMGLHSGGQEVGVR